MCEARQLTTWYHDDEVCWIADCEVCGVPMVVWRHHGADAPREDVEHMLSALRDVADALFGADGYRIDDHMRNIPDHYHAHARDREFWARFTSRGR